MDSSQLLSILPVESSELTYAGSTFLKIVSFPPILIMKGAHAVACLLFLSFVANSQARIHGMNPKSNTELAKSYLQTLKLSLTGELLKTDSIVPGTGTADQLKKKPFDAHFRS